MSVCRSCGQPIRWIRTTTGKNMPVDPEELNADDLTSGTILVTLSGQVHRVGGERNQPNVKGFISHFSTCPDAKEWRKV